MNVVDVWLEYQGITGTTETQAGFYNYLNGDMIDNTYNRFMIRSTYRRRRIIVDYDDKKFDDYNPLFGLINGAPRCLIDIHVTPNKNRKKKR